VRELGIPTLIVFWAQTLETEIPSHIMNPNKKIAIKTVNFFIVASLLS
jgi:hypothetical protein